MNLVLSKQKEKRKLRRSCVMGNLKETVLHTVRPVIWHRTAGRTKRLAGDGIIERGSKKLESVINFKGYHRAKTAGKVVRRTKGGKIYTQQ